jgi:protein phosphatase
MQLIFEARTDTGRKRDHNEDTYHINPQEKLFILADGMGGQAAGETASSLAVKNIDEFMRNTNTDAEITWPTEYNSNLTRNGNRLKAAILLSHRKIYELSLSKSKLGGMGTTVAVVVFDDDNTMTYAHVGDSRIYLLQDNKIDQLTNDHSWVNEQVRLGLLTPEEASIHPYRNVVTRALGGKEEFEVDIGEQKMKNEDIVLICSDGLNTMLKDDEIKKLVIGYKDDQAKAVEKLINAANKAGGDDNVTVILIRFTQ